MSKYKLIFCVIFLQSCDAEERRRRAEADRRLASRVPPTAETFVSSRLFAVIVEDEAAGGPGRGEVL